MISSYSLLKNKNSHLKFSEELYIHEARDNLVVYFDCIYIYIYIYISLQWLCNQLTLGKYRTESKPRLLDKPSRTDFEKSKTDPALNCFYSEQKQLNTDKFFVRSNQYQDTPEND